MDPAPARRPVSSWAFAHWGGKLYIFVTAGGNSQLQLFDPTTGQTTSVLSDLPFDIVVAGVSTCAPLVIG